MMQASGLHDIAAATATGLGVALGAGLLIGLERERDKGDGPRRAAAGVRTFALLALAGAVADLIGTAGVVVAGLFVTFAMLASYRRTAARDPGLTTEVAMLATFLTGILAMRMPVLAGGLGVVIAIVLASKSRLHRFSRQVLTEQELHDLLLLAGAAFVVLPLLPDRTVDPWQAINPYRLWVLVVAVMTVSSLGYVALRAFDSRLGLTVAGLAGGFVSSTATIAAMGERARASPGLAAAAASAGLMSNVATAIQLAIVLGALSPPLLQRTAAALVVAGAVAVLAALQASWRAAASPVDTRQMAGTHPFDPWSVLRFVAVLAGVMLLAAIVRDRLGDASLPWVLAASGLADVHAAAASAAQLVASSQTDLAHAVPGLIAAFAANSTLKCVVAWAKGGAAYALRLIPGTAAMLLAFAAAMLSI